MNATSNVTDGSAFKRVEANLKASEVELAESKQPAPTQEAQQPDAPSTVGQWVQRAWLSTVNTARALVGKPPLDSAGVVAKTDPANSMVVDKSSTPEKEHAKWNNWPGTVNWQPGKIIEPQTTEYLAGAVADARKNGQTVRVVGSGFSWTDITRGHDGAILVKTDGLNKIHDIVPQADGSAHVTVGGGIKLRDLNEQLWDAGYHVHNLGTVTYQSLAGVISTNTHGTGIDKGGFATQVKEIEVVDGRGEVIKASRDENPEVFDAVRSGIGLAGIITKATLEVRPRFHVHTKEDVMPLSDLTDQSKLDALLNENEWFQFSVIPYSGKAFTVTANTTDAEPTRNGDGAVQETFLRHVEPVFAGALRKVPSLVPAAAGLFSKLAPKGDYVDRPYRSLSHETRVSGQNLQNVEFFFPAEHTSEILDELNATLDRGRASGEFQTHFPLLVRFMAGDETYLSYAHRENPDDRITAITIFYEPSAGTKGDMFANLRKAIDKVLARHGKLDKHTVHLGKQMADFTPEEVRNMFPKLDDFKRVRDEMDPDGVFLNPFAAEWLGIETPEKAESKDSAA